MATGQVSFHDQRKVRSPLSSRKSNGCLTYRQVKKILVQQRENPIVNRLNKTKVEKHPDLQQEREDHLRQLRKKDQAAVKARVGVFTFFPCVFEVSGC